MHLLVNRSEGYGLRTDGRTMNSAMCARFSVRASERVLN